MLNKILAPENMPFSLPVLVALAVTLVVFLLFRGQRKKKLALASLAEGGKSSWVTDPGSLSDRRSSLRREGTPVKILATSPAFENGTNPGYVLDRSTSGLKLALEAGMATGSSMQVRAAHAPDSTPWVTVIVRNCKDTGEHFEMGCEFEKTPPWNVLLLFG
jgi:hypothetical protein